MKNLVNANVKNTGANSISASVRSVSSSSISRQWQQSTDVIGCASEGWDGY